MSLYCSQSNQPFLSLVLKVLMVLCEINNCVTLFCSPFSVRNSEAPARYNTTPAVLGKFIDYNCIYHEQNQLQYAVFQKRKDNSEIFFDNFPYFAIKIYVVTLN